jgi:hypothetical protein
LEHWLPLAVAAAATDEMLELLDLNMDYGADLVVVVVVMAQTITQPTGEALVHLVKDIQAELDLITQVQAVVEQVVQAALLIPVLEHQTQQFVQAMAGKDYIFHNLHI